MTILLETLSVLTLLSVLSHMEGACRAPSSGLCMDSVRFLLTKTPYLTRIWHRKPLSHYLCIGDVFTCLKPISCPMLFALYQTDRTKIFQLFMSRKHFGLPISDTQRLCSASSFACSRGNSQTLIFNLHRYRYFLKQPCPDSA